MQNARKKLVLINAKAIPKSLHIPAKAFVKRVAAVWMQNARKKLVQINAKGTIPAKAFVKRVAAVWMQNAAKKFVKTSALVTK